MSTETTFIPDTRQIENMKHAIGIKEYLIEKNSYIAFRNFFALSGESESWNELVSEGYATKRKQFNETVYHVSNKGINYLSEKLNISILTDESSRPTS